jgi:hypothetical protein
MGVIKREREMEMEKEIKNIIFFHNLKEKKIDFLPFLAFSEFYDNFYPSHTPLALPLTKSRRIR